MKFNDKVNALLLENYNDIELFLEYGDPNEQTGAYDTVSDYMFQSKIPGTDSTWRSIANVDSIGDFGSMIYFIASIFDPTGISSWPYLDEAIEEYEKDSGIFNTIMLVLAIIAIIPIAGKVGGLLKLLVKGGKWTIVALHIPFFIKVWLVKKLLGFLTKTGRVIKPSVFEKAAQKLSQVQVYNGKNLGEYFAKCMKKIFNVNIDSKYYKGTNATVAVGKGGKVTSVSTNISSTGRVTSKVGREAEAASKAAKVGKEAGAAVKTSRIPNAARELVGASRLAGGAGRSAAAAYDAFSKLASSGQGYKTTGRPGYETSRQWAAIRDLSR